MLEVSLRASSISFLVTSKKGRVHGRGLSGNGNELGILAGGGNYALERTSISPGDEVAHDRSGRLRAGVTDFLTLRYHELSLQRSVLAVTDCATASAWERLDLFTLKR